MDSFNGRNIVISEAHPRMQCSPKFVREMSPELVAETNAWMLGFFGMQETLPDGVIYELMGHTLTMNRKTYEKLRAAIALKGMP